MDIDLIKKQIKENPKAKVVCVKHSYPILLENGIKPWVCTILDPRPVTGLSMGKTSVYEVLYESLIDDAGVSSDTLYLSFF